MESPYNSTPTLVDFAANGHSSLLEALIKRDIHPQEQAEAFVYGLLHVAESIQKIYCKLIPELLDNDKLSSEEMLDRIHDIRSEFDHIYYHMEDGKLSLLPLSEST